MEYDGNNRRNEANNNHRIIINTLNDVKSSLSVLAEKVTNLEKTTIGFESTLIHVTEYASKCENELDSLGNAVRKLELIGATNEGMSEGKSTNKDNNNKNITLLCTILACSIGIATFVWSMSQSVEERMSKLVSNKTKSRYTSEDADIDKTLHNKQMNELREAINNLHRKLGN